MGSCHLISLLVEDLYHYGYFLLAVSQQGGGATADPLESGFNPKVGENWASHCAPVSSLSVSLLLAASSPAPALLCGISAHSNLILLLLSTLWVSITINLCAPFNSFCVAFTSMWSDHSYLWAQWTWAEWSKFKVILILNCVQVWNILETKLKTVLN